MIGKNNVYMDIGLERAAQDAEYGGRDHDDEHERADWLNFIQKQYKKAVDASDKFDALDIKLDDFDHDKDDADGSAFDDMSVEHGLSLIEYRTRLVMIAALCVAAVESLDRSAR